MTDLLAQLKGVARSGDGWTARCPAHEQLWQRWGSQHSSICQTISEKTEARNGRFRIGTAEWLGALPGRQPPARIAGLEQISNG
jgi:hypothetical protein